MGTFFIVLVFDIDWDVLMSFHCVLSKFEAFSSWSFPPLQNHDSYYYYYLTTSQDARSSATKRVELMIDKSFKAHRDLLPLPWRRHSYYYRRQMRHQPSPSLLFLCLRPPSSSSMTPHRLSWLHRWNQ